MKKIRGIRAVVADADNTLYSWIDYIVPCMEAMTDALCRVTGFDRDAIVSSMKEIFNRRRTNEYAFVLQEADIFEDLRRDFQRFQDRVIYPARFAFNRARKLNLRLYPGVRRTLRVLCSHGIRVIVLSDAPAFSAEQRLKHLDIARYICALYALKSYPVPKSGMLDWRIANRIRMGYYRSGVNRVVELPLDYEKPSRRGLERILKDERLAPGSVLLIGDNRKKDIRIAQELGIADVWARYGTVFAEGSMEKLSYYSAPEIQRRNISQPGEVSFQPTHTVDRFDELLGLIEL